MKCELSSVADGQGEGPFPLQCVAGQTNGNEDGIAKPNAKLQAVGDCHSDYLRAIVKGRQSIV